MSFSISAGTRITESGTLDSPRSFDLVSSGFNREIDLGRIQVVADGQVRATRSGGLYKATCYWRKDRLDNIVEYLDIEYYSQRKLVKHLQFFESRHGNSVYWTDEGRKDERYLAYDCQR